MGVVGFAIENPEAEYSAETTDIVFMVSGMQPCAPQEEKAEEKTEPPEEEAEEKTEYNKTEEVAAEQWIVEHSKGYQNAQRNTNNRRFASVAIMIMEVSLASMVYAADLAVGRYDYSSDKDKTWMQLYNAQVSDAFYLMMMTFSTVGYGDYAPSSDWGQAMSPLAMQAGTGIFGLATTRMTTATEDEIVNDFGQGGIEAFEAPPTLRLGLINWINSCKDVSLMPEPMRRFWDAGMNDRNLKAEEKRWG